MEVLVFMILVRVDMVIAAMMMQAAIVMDLLHQISIVPVTMDRLEVSVVPQEDTVALQEVTVVPLEDTVALQGDTVVPREIMVAHLEVMVVLQEVMEVL